ncbi:peptidylprolyl isomerase [Nocardioides sp.]|uniref:peptidylprolyl isomerase n=1 Tax=Nocardioides sp. TaxID=35761 RepID=UPI0039E66B55
MTTVRFQTQLGDFEVTLADEAAPITTANFLRYVDAHAYDGGTFFRTVSPETSGNDLIPEDLGELGDYAPNDSVPISVVQAGTAAGRQDFSPIPLERTDVTGVRHVDGAISVSRLDPDSATSEIFLCLGDQPQLDAGGARNPDGLGFAAFGAVTAGMEVVRAIHSAPSEGQLLAPPIVIERVSLCAG